MRGAVRGDSRILFPLDTGTVTTFHPVITLGLPFLAFEWHIVTE